MIIAVFITWYTAMFALGIRWGRGEAKANKVFRRLT